MAIGYTLVTRRIQAVLLHAGAGLLQGPMAINGALLACVPMLVFSSEGVTFGERPGVDLGSQWYRNPSVVGGTRSLIAPTVKWPHEAASVEPFGMLGLSVTRPDQLASALQRAIESVAAGTTAKQSRGLADYVARTTRLLRYAGNDVH